MDKQNKTPDAWNGRNKLSERILSLQARKTDIKIAYSIFHSPFMTMIPILG